MAFLEFQADLTRTANALERIASVLETLILLSDPAARRLANAAQRPPIPEQERKRAYRRVTDEELWRKEIDEEQARLSSQGLPSVLPET